MKDEKSCGSVYSISRSENVSHSENSSASLSISDPDEALVEEQEPSSSGIPNEFCTQGISTVVCQQTCPWAKRQYQPTFERFLFDSQQFFESIPYVKYLSLHDEVMDLYLWLKPTAEEIFLRRQVFRRVAEQLNLLFPNVQVAMFGSVATNLFLPSSDIDISVNLNDYTTDNLYHVANLLRELDMFDNINIIDRTSVPIVKLRDKQTQFYIDVSFNVHKAALRNVEFLNNKKESIPELEPLVLVLKQFLAQRGFNHPFNGGLSSYGLILMVLGFLKCFPKRNIGENCLGLLLFEFFRFYGRLFDYSQFGIRFRYKEFPIVGKYVLAKSMNEDMCSSILFIEDPIQRGNNVGKSTHNMIAIKEAFAEAVDSIGTALLQCHYTDQDFVHHYYYGPMISLVISFTEEEINYRKFQREVFLQYNKEGVGMTRYILGPLQNYVPQEKQDVQPDLHNFSNTIKSSH